MSVIASTDSGSPPKKVRKGEEFGDTEMDGANPEKLHRFGGFSVERVLNDRPRDKLMIVSGKFEGADDKAVVILEKTPFTKESASKILTSNTKTDLILQNDIYSTFQSQPPSNVNDIKTTLIYPATQKHIDKNTAQDVYVINETPSDYQEITLPFIKENEFSTQWVFNILEKKKEAERIVFEDEDAETGFILLPDMKWDAKQVEDLYLVAIVHKRGLRSIRDLNHTHLPLLNNIMKKGTSAIMEKYGIGANKLRTYLHYQPSYYHLHVHMTHARFDAPGCNIGRAVGLQDVINNLSVDSDYYKKATLTYILGENTGLCKKFKEENKL